MTYWLRIAQVQGCSKCVVNMYWYHLLLIIESIFLSGKLQRQQCSFYWGSGLRKRRNVKLLCTCALNFALGPHKRLLGALSCCSVAPVCQYIGTCKCAQEKEQCTPFCTVMHEATTSGSRHTHKHMHQVTWHTVARSAYAPGWAGHCCMYTPDLLSRCTSVIHTSHITARSRISPPSHVSLAALLEKRKEKKKNVRNHFFVTHLSERCESSSDSLNVHCDLLPFFFPGLWRRQVTKGMRRNVWNK